MSSNATKFDTWDSSEFATRGGGLKTPFVLVADGASSSLLSSSTISIFRKLADGPDESEVVGGDGAEHAFAGGEEGFTAGCDAGLAVTAGADLGKDSSSSLPLASSITTFRKPLPPPLALVFVLD